MTICLIGNGVYTIDSCTAVITSDGSPGVQKFNFPASDFRVYVLKKESGCGYIPGNLAILYYYDSWSGKWIETSRVNSPNSYGYVFVWWDVIGSYNYNWKIVWGDCTKEFTSGSAPPLGEVIVNDIMFRTDRWGNKWITALLTGSGYLRALIDGSEVWTGYYWVHPDDYGKAWKDVVTINDISLGEMHYVCLQDAKTLSGKCMSVCIPFWKCEEGQTGYEVDGCGSRRENPECAYREAVLDSPCQWQEYVVAGQPAQVVITVNQGSKTEDYELVFSGDYIGESAPFTVNAGTGQQRFTVNNIVFTTGGEKTITASLVKV